MKHLKAFETGIQRLYYVAWVFFSSGMSWELVKEVGRTRASSEMQLLYLVAGLVFFWAVPWVFMRVARWVYRGFVPADAGKMDTA